MSKHTWKTEFYAAVGELLSTPEVQRLKRLRHHHNTTRYQHTVRVAELSFRAAKRLGLDAGAAARGAVLHDLFYHDSTCRPEGYRGWVILNHPEEAAMNARKLTDLTEKEENIILSHMWPVSRHMPHSREALLVDFVDNCVAVSDYLDLEQRFRKRRRFRKLLSHNK